MKFVALLLPLLCSLTAHACPVCRPKVEAGIYAADYVPRLLLVLLPAFLLLALGLGLFYWDKISARFPRAHAIAS
jgi:hypothetical protein